MSHDDLKVEELDADDFDDEELDQLLEEDQAPDEEEPQAQPERERWHPSGPCFRGEIIDEEKLFCVDGKMVPESQLQAAQEDPGLYTFLFEKQKAGLELELRLIPPAAIPRYCDSEATLFVLQHPKLRFRLNHEQERFEIVDEIFVPLGKEATSRRTQ